MGAIFSKPKAPDTSKQERLLEQQQKDLKEQRAQAQREADALRDQRVASQKRARGRMSGRRSLIATSELGTKDKLG